MSTILNAYNLNGGDTTSSVFTYAGATRNLDIEIITDSIGGLSAYVIIETSSDESNWILVPNSQIQINRGSDSYVYHITESEGAYVRVRLFRMDSHSGTMTITANEAAVTGLLEAANNLSDVANAATARTNLGMETTLDDGSNNTFPSSKAVATYVATLIPIIECDIYTPTYVAASAVNLNSDPTFDDAQYQSITDPNTGVQVVTVSGSVTINPTLTLTATAFRFTLPIATTGTGSSSIRGVAASSSSGDAGIILSFADGNASFAGAPASTGALKWSFTLTYSVN